MPHSGTEGPRKLLPIRVGMAARDEALPALRQTIERSVDRQRNDNRSYRRRNTVRRHEPRRSVHPTSAPSPAARPDRPPAWRESERGCQSLSSKTSSSSRAVRGTARCGLGHDKALCLSANNLYVHREPLKQDRPRPHSLLQQDHGCPGWHTGHAPRSRGRRVQKRCQTVGCRDGTQTCFPSHGGRSAAQENVSSGLRLRTASRWARGSWILTGNPAAT